MNRDAAENLAERVTSVPATTRDFEELVEIRIAAMRESLERIGRFDPARARERLKNSFYPEYTHFVLWDRQRVGFYTFRPVGRSYQLDHLYLQPTHQSQGIGSHVLRQLLAAADFRGVEVHVGALKESASNRFYLRHGFLKQKDDDWDNYYVRPAAERDPKLNYPEANEGPPRASSPTKK